MMAITFIPQNRRQRYLLIILGGVLLVAIGIFLWYQFLRIPYSISLQTQPPPPRNVNIDFTVFENSVFLGLGQPQPPIPILQTDEIGKPNPFSAEGGLPTGSGSSGELG